MMPTQWVHTRIWLTGSETTSWRGATFHHITESWKFLFSPLIWWISLAFSAFLVITSNGYKFYLQWHLAAPCCNENTVWLWSFLGLSPRPRGARRGFLFHFYPCRFVSWQFRVSCFFLVEQNWYLCSLVTDGMPESSGKETLCPFKWL